MRTTTFLALALAAATCPVPFCLAAPAATQDQADALRAMFERYLGHPAAGEPDRVTVVPEGSAYRASVDLQQIMRPLERFGLSIEPASQTLLLAPNDNGTWHVTSNAMPPLRMHLKTQTITLNTSTYTFDGTYDPKLGMFVEETSTQDGATLDQEAPTLSQHRRSGHAVLTEKGAPADNGTVGIDGHYALSDVTATMTMRSPPPKDGAEPAPDTPAAPPVDLSYSMPTSTVDVRIDRLPALKLLDLWAFLVAHPTHDALTASQDELRGLLRAALPLLGGLKEGATADSLVVKTQIGDFAAHTLAGALEFRDLAGTGTAVSALKIDGLVLPGLGLPAWTAGFMPSALDLEPTVSGLHVNEALNQAVDAFDLTTDGLKPEQGRAIGHTLWPGDGKVVLAPSRITSALLDLKFEGEATIGAAPVGRLSVTATGLDKAIATVQAAAGTDPTAAQVLTMLVTAKNLAKPDPDGTLGWVIEAAADHAVTVNGVPLK